MCVRWNVLYSQNLRNLEVMMAVRVIIMDHATVHRWVLKIVPILACAIRRRNNALGSSWWVASQPQLVRRQKLRDFRKSLTV